MTLSRTLAVPLLPFGPSSGTRAGELLLADLMLAGTTRRGDADVIDVDGSAYAAMTATLAPPGRRSRDVVQPGTAPTLTCYNPLGSAQDSTPSDGSPTLTTIAIPVWAATATFRSERCRPERGAGAA